MIGSIILRKRIVLLLLLLGSFCFSTLAGNIKSRSNALIFGDANGDGIVNAADIVEVANYIKGYPSTHFNPEGADVNFDGYINAGDILGITNIIMDPRQEDARSLIVLSKDGSSDSYGLEEKPKMTFTETELVITTKFMQVKYALADIIRFTYSTNRTTY